MKQYYSIFLLAIISVLATTGTKAQEAFDGLYSTQNGLVQVNLVYNDSGYTAFSNQLRANLNYDNASLTMNLDLRTLKTNADTMNALWLSKLVAWDWQLKGKLNLNYINTEDNKTEVVTMDGYINNPKGQYKITANGELRHTMSDPLACLLTLSFKIKLSALGIPTDEHHGLRDEVSVTIYQSVLKHE